MPLPCKLPARVVSCVAFGWRRTRPAQSWRAWARFASVQVWAQCCCRDRPVAASSR